MITMQIMRQNAGTALLSAFDSRKLGAYPRRYVFPIYRRQHVLLLHDPGVWVGIHEILPPTRHARVGFMFHPQMRAGSRIGPIFGILRNETRRRKKHDDRDCKRNL
jgi:hypothetical protein